MGRRLALISFVAAIACGGGELSVNSGHSTNGATDDSSQTSRQTNGGTNGSTSTGTNDGTNTVGMTNSSTNGTTNNQTVPVTNNQTVPSTNNQTVPATNNTTGTNNDPQFHPMFVAVADFMREKCIACHAQGQNGNFQIPSAESTNEEVRVALEGVQSTRGNLLIEPGNPEQSQVYIMITNDAGEQFPPETIAIVEDWIVAGAPYTE